MSILLSLHRLSTTFLSFTVLTGAILITSAMAEGPSFPEGAEIEFEVLDRREADLGERKIIFKRVARPDLPVRQKPEPVELTEESRSVGEPEQARGQETLFLDAIVYNNEVTDLKWRHEGVGYRAWSNIDFNLFPGFSQIEDEVTVFTVLIVVDECSREGTDDGEGWVPEPRDFDSGQSDYLIVRADSPNEDLDPEAFAGIEAMHVYFDQHRETIQSAYTQRKEAQAERERELKENPPKMQDVEIYFWPIRSRNHD